MLPNFNLIFEKSWTKINNKTWRQRWKSREREKQKLETLLFGHGILHLGLASGDALHDGERAHPPHPEAQVRVPSDEAEPRFGGGSGRDADESGDGAPARKRRRGAGGGRGEPHCRGRRSHCGIANLESLSSLEINNEWERERASLVCLFLILFTSFVGC